MDASLAKEGASGWSPLVHPTRGDLKECQVWHAACALCEWSACTCHGVFAALHLLVWQARWPPEGCTSKEAEYSFHRIHRTQGWVQAHQLDLASLQGCWMQAPGEAPPSSPQKNSWEGEADTQQHAVLPAVYQWLDRPVIQQWMPKSNEAAQGLCAGVQAAGWVGCWEWQVFVPHCGKTPHAVAHVPGQQAPES